MTYSSRKQQSPVALRFKQPATDAKLIVHGQGVVMVQSTAPPGLLGTAAITITFTDASGGQPLTITFGQGYIGVFAGSSRDIQHTSATVLQEQHHIRGIVRGREVPYWVSLDTQNKRLCVGVGEARIETCSLTYVFPNKAWPESLVNIQTEGAHITRLLRDPITRSVPLLVKPTEELTMDQIAAGNVLPVAALSPTQQQLYNTIAGPNFKLDTPDFPQFTAAIEHSIRTPGCWAYERLKKKATEFSKEKPDPKETYLRITLGENNGESPGIPYVMEIWPVGHYSPVHNHGGADAVIRVLNGSIQVSLYPFLSQDAVAPFATAKFSKGDVTWISPTLNQVHQLRNLEGNKDTCITIQCYMYEESDKAHYDYFDYVSADATIQQFEPDSDMDFVQFKKTMRREWLEYRAKCMPLPGWPWKSAAEREAEALKAENVVLDRKAKEVRYQMGVLEQKIRQESR
jgi:predicted metal-dependent enzyme (double-stranded beta helix superfamily)